MLDSPKKWYEKKLDIEKIAQLRTSLINSKQKIDVEEKEKFLNTSREIAMASKPIDIEVSLQKTPQNVQAGRIKPLSASGSIKNFLLAENPSVDRKIEKAYYDTDWKTENAIEKIYGKGVDNYKIQQAFSMGMMGEKENRKLVPTRWSITASDDIISKNLRSQIKENQELGQIEYYQNNYLGNEFHIFLIPGKWEHELIELKRPGSTWNAGNKTYVAQNFEPYSGRKSYAEETAGAFYASRLGVLEHLKNRGRQSKALIVREVTPDYWAPLGVWVIRETVRNAFEEEPEELENFKEVKWRLSKQYRFQYDLIRSKSRMLEGRQSSLRNYTH